MTVLLVGAGGVGEAIVSIAHAQDPAGEWLESMIVADYDVSRAEAAVGRVDDPRFIPVQVDGGDHEAVSGLAERHQADLIMNACDPRLNMPIFEAAFTAGCTYMDMAMSLSQRHPEAPFTKTHIKLGDLQFSRNEAWERKGLLALVGSGVEPGMVNVFARYADSYLFDEIHQLHVRDGDNVTVEGMDTAFGFSIWTTIEECLNPPVVWEEGRGWYTTAPFSQPEIFHFPEPIGAIEVVNVEHEEVLMLPRYFGEKGLKRCTFKYGLDEDFRRVIKMLEALGLDKTEKVRVGDVEVSPRDVVAAAAPNPAEIGHLMQGAVSAGIWINGIKEGKERNVYMYQLADNRECMSSLSSQAVVAQTAFNPVIMMELIARGIWKGTGVKSPEWFPPEPFMERMDRYGFRPGMMEMESEYKRSIDEAELQKGYQ